MAGITPLGYVVNGAKGEADLLLAEVVARLEAEAVALAGVVQENTVFDPDRACHMDLRILGLPEKIRISQDLGPLSEGCRLNVPELERAVGLVQSTLSPTPPALLVLNKFGKHEAEGRGFRPMIGWAFGEGIPVLTGVNPKNLPALTAFAEDLATELPPEAEAILAWCRAALD